MKFEWDDAKASSNLKKHKVSFEDASSVFSDQYHLSIPDDFHSDEEDRWISIGSTTEKLILITVVHTYRDEDDNEVIRIISARKATTKEKREYLNRRR